VAGKLVTDIIGKHAGKRIVVMGGAPSLPGAVAGLDADVWISANQHGAMLRPVDYIYAADVHHQVMKLEGKRMPMAHLLHPFGVPVISKRWWADYRIPADQFPITGNSGLQAIGAAVLLGANPVIVAGIEMYRTGHTYYHAPSAVSSGNRRDDSEVARVIAELVEAVKGQNVRRIGCPLLPFPEYDPAEVFDTQPPLPAWASAILTAQQHPFRVRWSFMRAGEEFKGGEIVMLTDKEAAEARMAKRLSPCEPGRVPTVQPQRTQGTRPAANSLVQSARKRTVIRL
jgi:hypothetical protein